MRKRVEATLAVLLILSCVGLRLAYTRHLTPSEERVDLINIDALSPYGKLERPIVRFPHEKHVAGVETESGCLLCHDPRPEDEAGILFTLKGRQGLAKDALQELYHSQCIGCHADREAAKQPTGPQICSGCHVNSQGDAPSISHSLDFDPRLHALHTEKASLDCASCHDALDAAPRPEGSAKGHVATPDNPSHALCISCHLTEQKNGHSRAPLDCSGCHALPPMAPDDALAAGVNLQGGEVAFDHDLHEEADISCEVCHHKEPETSCSECHTDGDSSRGGGVSLHAAMHSKVADRSCIGCHDAMGAGEVDDCTGCHAPFSSGNQ